MFLGTATPPSQWGEALALPNFGVSLISMRTHFKAELPNVMW